MSTLHLFATSPWVPLDYNGVSELLVSGDLGSFEEAW
jgi:hypothetical protein